MTPALATGESTMTTTTKTIAIEFAAGTETVFAEVTRIAGGYWVNWFLGEDQNGPTGELVYEPSEPDAQARCDEASDETLAAWAKADIEEALANG